MSELDATTEKRIDEFRWAPTTHSTDALNALRERIKQLVDDAVREERAKHGAIAIKLPDPEWDY